MHFTASQPVGLGIVFDEPAKLQILPSFEDCYALKAGHFSAGTTDYLLDHRTPQEIGAALQRPAMLPSHRPTADAWTNELLFGEVPHVPASRPSPSVRFGMVLWGQNYEEEDQCTISAAAEYASQSLKVSTKVPQKPSVHFTCPICFEVPEEICAVEPCLHLFCRKCIADWFNTLGGDRCTCPLCRSNLTGETRNLPQLSTLVEDCRSA